MRTSIRPTSALLLRRPSNFLRERDYVTFESLLLQIRLSSVVSLLSVTFVHPTQRVENFGNISSPFDPLTSVQNFTVVVPCRVTRPSGALNARGVAK